MRTQSAEPATEEDHLLPWLVKTGVKAGWPPLAIFLYFLVSLKTGHGIAFAGFDKVMHVLSGIAIAHFFHGLLVESYRRGHMRKIAPPRHAIRIFLLTCGAAVLWEVAEVAAEYLYRLQPHASPREAMLDILPGILGGLAFVLLHPSTFAGKTPHPLSKR